MGMVKTGEVCAVTTPCDYCDNPSVTVVAGHALCAEHTASGTKMGSLGSDDTPHAITVPSVKLDT